uniref:Fibronectin type-III domain-containing protein n=1 Tax=Astyanax mexicanus TaxID=7994 RepID=A0A3B1KGR9_ASTMX
MIRTLLSLLLLCPRAAAGGKVPSPEDVTVISQDMGLILKWNPPKNSTGQNFTYTAEYSGYQPFFLTVCGSTSSLSCDFTDMVSAFGVYDLRVRTEREGNSSDWIVKENISLDKITVISAPGVKLQSRKGEIEVNITGPTLKKSNLEELFNSMSYRIRYWIDGQVEKKELRAEQSRVMLQSLTPNVRYCVQVEILTSSFTEESKEKPSLPSNHTCILNTENDDVELWLILVVLLGSFVVVLVSVVLVFFACWFSYKGFRFLHPEAKLPEHFKQYLCERPKSSLFLAMQNSPQPEERYHEVSIVQCLDDPSALQQLQQAQGSNRTRPYANISPKPEDGQNRGEMLCEREHRKNEENAGRSVRQSGEEEMQRLLLQ